MPSAEPTVMDMVLTELRAIRDSIHGLRDSMHSEIGALATRINRIEMAQSEQRGAISALRWIGALVIAALGSIEAWLHRGHP